MAVIKSPWVGSAKGKLGAATYYRRNGKQCARSIPVEVKNPNTVGQLVQRAVTATIMRAYAAGKTIFDHSFEGVAVGAQSQARFMKLNMKNLREAVIDDLREGLPAETCSGAVIGRGSVIPIPYTYIISQGTLVQNLFTEAANGVKLVAPAGDTTTVAEFCAANGLSAGDIFTVVTFATYSTDWASQLEVQPSACTFGFIRFTVKESALTSTAVVSDHTGFDELFDIDQSGVTDTVWSGKLLTDSITYADIVGHAVTGCIGVIRSREDSGERSNCEMSFWDATNNMVTRIPQNGIKSSGLLAAWNPDADSFGESDLILEGGNF